MASGLTSRYRSASALALWATLLYVALTVIEVLTAFSLASQIQLLDAARFGTTIFPSQAEAQDARQRLLGILELTSAFGAGLLLLGWVYRVNRNARLIGAEGMTYSPGWSVGWFFVPLANLFMPYRVLRELWKANTPEAGEHWRHAAVSPVVGAWWLVCLVRGVIQYSPWPIVTGHWRLAELSRFGPNWVDGLWEFSWGFLIAEVVGIAANVLTVAVILSITGLQERRHVLFADSADRQFAAVD